MKKFIIYLGLTTIMVVGCKSESEKRAQKLYQIWEQKKLKENTEYSIESAKINGVCLGVTITSAKAYDMNSNIHKIFFSDIEMQNEVPLEFRAKKISDAELVGCIEDTIIQDTRIYNLDEHTSQEMYNKGYEITRNQYKTKVSIYIATNNKLIASKIFLGELRAYPELASQNQSLNGQRVKVSEILDWLFPVLTKDPVIKTISIYSLPSDSVICTGEVIYDGTSNILERGICWSTNPDPVVENNKSIFKKAEKTFICKLTGLKKNTTYYARSYIKNVKNVFYGNVIEFNSEFKFIDKRDNHVYHIATIGSQTMMIENFVFKSEEYKEYPYPGKVYIYRYCYKWKVANEIAPIGWHLPSMEEWETLNDFIGDINFCMFFGITETVTDSINYIDSRCSFWSNNSIPDQNELNNVRLFRD